MRDPRQRQPGSRRRSAAHRSLTGPRRIPTAPRSGSGSASESGVGEGDAVAIGDGLGDGVAAPASRSGRSGRRRTPRSSARRARPARAATCRVPEPRPSRGPSTMTGAARATGRRAASAAATTEGSSPGRDHRGSRGAGGPERGAARVLGDEAERALLVGGQRCRRVDRGAAVVAAGPRAPPAALAREKVRTDLADARRRARFVGRRGTRPVGRARRLGGRVGWGGHW